MSDFEAIQKALFEAANTKRVPDIGGFYFDAAMNILAFPALGWLIFAWAGLLPWSFAGYLSVVATVALLRLCVLDVGLARLDYKIVPIDDDTAESSDEEDE